MSEEHKQVMIDRIEMGSGWSASNRENNRRIQINYPDNLYTWLQRNPEFNVRAVLPIVENGNTVAIHVWFD